MYKINVIILLFIVFLSQQAYSQKLGLVLSGGGAKGLAHIGVIRALEENNIPIDYVVGTSMGAIVAGLYACGYTPNEMEMILKDQKFVNYYKGVIPDEHYYYFKKTQANSSNLRLGLMFKDSLITLSLPTNFIATQPMDFGILEYFSNHSARANNNFDSLFIPFRCVAADIYHSKEAVFNKGDLGNAIRASMTVPFYFKPVEIDSILYFDGGIYNNFPVDVMENVFNPDFIIGVTVTNDVPKPNPDDLLVQVENLLIGKKNYDNVDVNKGLTIKIKFDNVGLLDFHKQNEMTNKGYNACMSIMDSIKLKYPLRQDSLELKVKRNLYKAQLPQYIFDKITLKGVDKGIKFYVENSIKREKKKISIAQLESEYYKLISDFQFKSARPAAKFNNKTGYFDIAFDVKKENRLDILLGACIASGYSNQVFVGTNYKILNKVSILLNANAYFGRDYTSFHFGSRLDIPLTLPLALEFEGNINRYDYYKVNNQLFTIDLKPPYIVNFDNNVRLDLFTPLSKKTIIKLGVVKAGQNYKYFQVRNFLASDTADYTTFSPLSIHLSIISNNHNFDIYPNKGNLSYISLRYVYGNEFNKPGSTTALTNEYNKSHSWIQCDMLFDHYYKVGKYLTTGFFAQLFISNKPFYRNYFSSLLSAESFEPIVHSKTIFLANYNANSFAAVGIKPIITFSERLNLRMETYLYAPFQKILKEEPYKRVYMPYYSESYAYFHNISSMALVYNSPIGPIAISINYYSAENVKTYFMFHLGYILFNKKAYDF